METSTDYVHPYRPRLVRFANAIGKALKRIGFNDELQVDRLLASARRKTGLSDFGDEWFLEGLQKLVDSVNSEARLTFTGRFIQRVRLQKVLINRLYIEEYVKRHPETMDVDLGTVLFIVGMQRTGTTTLHRLINSHPEIQGLTAWEALNPVPLPNEDTENPRRRRFDGVLSEKTIRYLSPDFMAVHPIHHDQPEEDVLLLDLSFMSQSAEATMYVPSYASWLEKQDQTRAYEYFQKVLKILHWLHPSKGWVLKTPHHMEYLSSLLKVFPNATLIETYRDPQKTLPSFCSMVAHARGMMSDKVDPLEIGCHWGRKVERMVDHVVQTRSNYGDDPFVAISYYELVDDPISELQRVYAKATIPFDPIAETRAREIVSTSPKDRFGRHVYQADSFGLTEDVIEERLKNYRALHSIPFE